MQVNKILVIILLLLAGVGLYFYLSNSKVVEDYDDVSNNVDLLSLKKALHEEFINAYDKDIVPNGNIVEMDMTAAPSELEIFSAEDLDAKLDNYKTEVWAYNGQVPGPEIRLQLGDTLRLNFTNNLPQETTIHFHGVRVPNAMDGVPGVTQAPIQPGEKFVYEFTPKDAGTFWFHPHVRSSEQVERGLFGTLIVEDEVSQKYSQDVVWVLDDWRLTQDLQVNPNFNTPMDLMHDGRWGNVITVNGKLDEKLQAKPGERIRLRLVNTSNARVYAPNFANLKPVVIAVDGMYVKNPFPLERFELAPGNRLDLDITIPDTPGTMVVSDDFGRNVIKLAEIVVQGEKVTTPDFAYPRNENVPDWVDANILPVDKEYVLNARRKNSGGGMMGDIEWTINDKAYPDYDPFTFKYDEMNIFQFTNQSSRLHPMHLHGQFFKVVSRNGKVSDEEYFRDTVLVRPKETVVLATVPLDKGRWVNHCHILEHAEAGMMTVVEVE